MGLYCERGQDGVPPSMEQAEAWYRRAAAQGHARSRARLDVLVARRDAAVAAEKAEGEAAATAAAAAAAATAAATIAAAAEARAREDTREEVGLRVREETRGETGGLHSYTLRLNVSASVG
jgi:TPR repeat protein